MNYQHEVNKSINVHGPEPLHALTERNVAQGTHEDTEENQGKCFQLKSTGVMGVVFQLN